MKSTIAKIKLEGSYYAPEDNNEEIELSYPKCGASLAETLINEEISVLGQMLNHTKDFKKKFTTELNELSTTLSKIQKCLPAIEKLTKEMADLKKSIAALSKSKE